MGATHKILQQDMKANYFTVSEVIRRWADDYCIALRRIDSEREAARIYITTYQTEIRYEALQELHSDINDYGMDIFLIFIESDNSISIVLK